MKYSCCYLPNGIQVDVTPVFGGFKFKVKCHEQYNSFPPEWTICLETKNGGGSHASNTGDPDSRPFTVPSLYNDTLYLSSLSLPSCKDLKPSSAPTRLVAMVLWVSFFWYFQEPEPTSPESSHTPDQGSAKEWQLSILARGILCRKDQMMKIERLGMVTSKDTSVGLKPGLGGLQEMFISQKSFWQLDPRIHLFSISSVMPNPGQVYPDPSASMDSLGIGFPFGAGPNTAGTFLPPYYPPQTLQYAYTGGVRHPRRPKAYVQGEVFYVRYIPSGGEYLTLRVPVLPTKDPVARKQLLDESNPVTGIDLCLDSDLTNDVELLYNWVQSRPPDTALPRRGSITEQSKFLEDRMRSQNSFPALVCWDSVPTAYFELFWVLEDPVGRSLGGADDFDRGVRCFIGDEGFLQPKHLNRCMSSLVHHCWLYDQRTKTVVFECRADKLDIIFALESIGFSKLKDVNLPSEYNTVLAIDRGSWVAPVL
ncbi:acyl-CoA N-acyltransferase [Aspergillus aurantiobrunneus]